MLPRYLLAPLAALALLTTPRFALAQTTTGSVGIGTTGPTHRVIQAAYDTLYFTLAAE
ncbi:MAG: hypothetical protein ACRYGH_11970 [Janthinobacterium lividum]